MIHFTPISTPIISWPERRYNSIVASKIHFNDAGQKQVYNHCEQDDVLSNVTPTTPFVKALLSARKTYLQTGGKPLSSEEIKKMIGRC